VDQRVNEARTASLERRTARLPHSSVSTPLAGRARRPSFLIPLFLFSLALPIILQVGPLRLSPYRLILIGLFIPCLVAWLRGSSGKIRSPDILILLAVLWTVMALVVHRGVSETIEGGGMYLIETFGSYLLARWLIRDAESFHAMARSFFWVILVMLPFAIFETLTGRPIIIDLLGKIFEVYQNVLKEPRWGLDRVQGPFQHPILFGVFSAVGFALSFYVLGYGRRGLNRIIRPAVVGFSVVLSLSSGPLSVMAAQLGIIAWDRFLQRVTNRWTIFFILFAAAYITVDLLSNRTPIEVFIAYTAFNPATAYSRINIWNYGSAEVLRHPLLGTGGSWEHPAWMTDSVDMFWLANAIVAGLPAAVPMALAPIIMAIKLGRAKIGDPRLASYRVGLVITIAGLCFAGWTVHFWNAPLPLVLFIIGSGHWLLDLKQTGNDDSESLAHRGALMPARAKKPAVRSAAAVRSSI